MPTRKQNRWGGDLVSKRAVQSASTPQKYDNVVKEFLAEIKKEYGQEWLDENERIAAACAKEPVVVPPTPKLSWQELRKTFKEYQPRPVRSTGKKVYQ
jgi:hypothetical protein